RFEKTQARTACRTPTQEIAIPAGQISLEIIKCLRRSVAFGEFDFHTFGWSGDMPAFYYRVSEPREKDVKDRQRAVDSAPAELATAEFSTHIFSDEVLEF